MDILRFVTAGNIDDGKSTLIGRLLYDTKSLFEEQLEEVRKASFDKNSGPIDFSLFTDGLKEERAKGITIDVAYRYFSSPKRKFIIADAPGHFEYVRNMVTGASTSELVLIVTDVSKPVAEQTYRHLFIASLLRISNLIVCVNKMDLNHFDKNSFDKRVQEFKKILSDLEFTQVHFIPVSALNGDNVVTRSENAKWYEGSSLIELLENVQVSDDMINGEARFPVQVARNPDPSGIKHIQRIDGRIAGGRFSKGEKIQILPSGGTSEIISVHSGEKEYPVASAGQSVSINILPAGLISRGNFLVKNDNTMSVSKEFDLMLCWFSEKKLDHDKEYTLLHAHSETTCVIKTVHFKMDMKLRLQNSSEKNIGMNDVVKVSVQCEKKICYDFYKSNKITGSVIVVDALSNETMGAGVIIK